jgi:ArsR family transcriptional regulator
VSNSPALHASKPRELPLLEDALACCTPLAREPVTAEACVCDLLPYFDLSQPTISHHLKVLHDAGLLDREKRGTWVFYLARPAAMAAVANLFVAPTGVNP